MSPDDIPEVLILTGFPVRMRLSFAVLILRNTPDLASGMRVSRPHGFRAVVHLRNIFVGVRVVWNVVPFFLDGLCAGERSWVGERGSERRREKESIGEPLTCSYLRDGG